MIKKSSLLSGLSLLFVLAASTQPTFANDAGKTIYTANCTTCHSKAMAAMMKAPIAQDSKSWNIFLTDAIKEATVNKTTDCAALTKSSSDTSKLSVSDSNLSKLTEKEKACYLLPIAIKGRTGASGAIMPAKGNCTSCKDSDLQSAIEFMLTDK